MFSPYPYTGMGRVPLRLCWEKTESPQILHMGKPKLKGSDKC